MGGGTGGSRERAVAPSAHASCIPGSDIGCYLSAAASACARCWGLGWPRKKGPACRAGMLALQWLRAAQLDVIEPRDFI